MGNDSVGDGRVMPDEADSAVSRRLFLLAALSVGAGGLLSGCAGSPTRSARLPSPIWPDTGPSASRDVPLEEDLAVIGPALPAGVLPRSRWAASRAIPSRMQPMLPIRYVTVHHSAGPNFYADDVPGTVDKLDRVRRFHQDKGWGDIGYHYAVDRAGRIWEGRSMRWQGAHVADYNEGNVGVVALGNFDQQHPTPAQLASVSGLLQILMQTHAVPVNRVRTHKEWSPTACPGVHLQRHMDRTRPSF